MPRRALSQGFMGGTFGLLALLAMPFFLVDLPPVLDFPNHLARIFVLGSPGDPILSRFYEPEWRILPNLAIDLIGPGLIGLLPVAVVGKLLLLAALLLPVGGAIVYGRAVMGREWSPWLIGVAIVGYNGLFLLGFMNFLYSVGLALFAAAFWVNDRRRHFWRPVLVGAVFAAIIFFCHMFGVLLFLLLIGCHELAALWQKDRLVSPEAGRIAAGIAVVVIPVLVLFWLSPVSDMPAAMVFDDPARKLVGLFTPFASYRALVGAGVGLAVLAIAILGWRRGRADPGTVLAIGALLVLYALAPSSLKGGTFVDERLIVMAGFLLFAGYRPVVEPGIQPFLPAVVFLLIAAKLGDAGLAWFEHGADLDRFRRVISSVPPGARVLVVDAAPGAPLRSGEPASRMIPGLHRTDLHLPALLTFENRAFWPFLFAEPSQQPLAVRPLFVGLAAPGREPPDAALLNKPGDDPLLESWRQKFDYLLVLHAGAAGDLNAFRADGLVFRAGSDLAGLYAIVR